MDKQRLLELASALVHAGLTNKDEEILKISEELAAVMGREESGNGIIRAAARRKGQSRLFFKFHTTGDFKNASKIQKIFYSRG